MTTKALAWIRKSKGTDNDIGLTQQRNDVKTLAEKTADEFDTIDLGVHTGFSSMSRSSGKMLDNNEKVIEIVEELKTGTYDYLIAYDDQRICRDGYLNVIEHACVTGDVEIKYAGDIIEHELTRDLINRTETYRKQQEIEKSKKAINEKINRGDDFGKPPTGFTYNTDKTKQIPDPTTFPDILKIIQLQNQGLSYSNIIEEVDIDITKTTISRIINKHHDKIKQAAINSEQYQWNPEKEIMLND